MKNQFSYFKRWTKIVVSKHFEKQLHLYEKRRLKKVLKNNDHIVLIYTIGKVGSASVYESIKQQKEFVDYPVLHVHSLSPSRIDEQKNYYRFSKRNSIPFHLVRSSVLSELLEAYQGEIYIFTLMREPIQREISSVFQDSFNFTSSQHMVKSGIMKVVNKKIEALIQDLPENKWFDQELKTVFGFDVFLEDFDPKIGFKIFQNGKTKLALVRFENLNDRYPQICQELFEMSIDFELCKRNMSDNKFYKKDYKEVQSQIALSEKDLEKIVSSKFIQKFYPDFIPTIKERWRKQD